MSTVYLGIGSNLGDRQKNIDSAMEKLSSKKGIEVAALSSVVETNPIGNPDHPKFLNAACKIETTLYPDELLDALKSIERELGRKKDSSSNRLSPEEQLKMLQDGKLTMADVTSQAAEKEDVEEDKWAPREIDLDILFYDDVVVKGNNLIIPHPLLHDRLFVLGPLSEIAGDFIHPLLKKSIKDIMDEYRQKQNEITQEKTEDSQQQSEDQQEETVENLQKQQSSEGEISGEDNHLI